MSDEIEILDEPKFVPVPLKIARKIPPTPKSKLIIGGPGTGKTRALVRSAAELSQRGEAVLVFCATPDAARSFSQRLAAQLPGKNGPVTVTTPRAFALRALDTDSARAFTGRDARLVAPFEEGFLMEDLKTSGLPPKRLREMTRFFFRSMTELGDDDPDWLINDEEKGLFNLLKSSVAFTRGILEPELSNLCVNYVRSKGAAASGLQRQHVIVDDYQLLSRASQYLANLLAGGSITVAADPDKRAQVLESYPYLAGVDEFAQVNEDCEKIELKDAHGSAASAEAVNALRADASLGLPALELGRTVRTGTITELKSATEADEMRSLARYAGEKAQEGATLYVVSPHHAWTRNIVRALHEQGIPVEGALDGRAIPRTWNDPRKSAAGRVACALALAADPYDGVAWRCWCGYGDYLGNSPAIAALRNLAQTHRLALDGMLDWAAHAPSVNGEQLGTASMQRVIAAYAQGIQIIRATRALEGKALLEALARMALGGQTRVPAIIERLTMPFEDGHAPGSDAAALCARLHERLDLPAFESTGSVRVGPAERLCGMRPDALAFAGFVNGFAPRHRYFDLTQITLEDRAKMREEDVRALAGAVGASDGDVAFSYFGETSLVAAEQLDLKIDRISVRKGQRRARVGKSVFLGIIQQEPDA